MRKQIIFLMLLLLVFISCPSFASGTNDLAQKNAELQQRVERVEKELAELKNLLKEQTESANSNKTAPQKIISQKEVSQNKVTTKNPVWSNLDIQLYGYIKADASYDQLRTNPGNYVLYVNPETGEKNDDEFNLTVKQTRLGMNIKGPESEGMQASGKIEVDFFGSGGAENKGFIQMRHGYLQLDWPEEHFSVLAGQTWDVFSPLNPSTLNYSVLWDSGNVGYRRPQIRLTKIVPLGNGSSFKAEAAIARAIGRSSPTTSESGEDSGFPNVQARTSFTFPFGGCKPTTVGFSGHWGQEEYDITGDHRTLETWSVNADVTQPVSKDLTIKGEFYHGVNMNAFLGGIGQGVNTSDTNNPFEIAAQGGWVAASLGPWDNWKFNLGAGIDTVRNNDTAAGNRTRNMCIFGNAIYSINEYTQVGFELSQWETNYKGPGDAQSLRGQMSIIYKF
jgi:hypothetical protein